MFTTDTNNATSFRLIVEPNDEARLNLDLVEYHSQKKYHIPDKIVREVKDTLFDIYRFNGFGEVDALVKLAEELSPADRAELIEELTAKA